MRAVRLWQHLGLRSWARCLGPSGTTLGYVDAHVMFKTVA